MYIIVFIYCFDVFTECDSTFCMFWIGKKLGFKSIFKKKRTSMTSRKVVETNIFKAMLALLDANQKYSLAFI